MIAKLSEYGFSTRSSLIVEAVVLRGRSFLSTAGTGRYHVPSIDPDYSKFTCLAMVLPLPSLPFKTVTAQALLKAIHVKETLKSVKVNKTHASCQIPLPIKPPKKQPESLKGGCSKLFPHKHSSQQTVWGCLEFMSHFEEEVGLLRSISERLKFLLR